MMDAPKYGISPFVAPFLTFMLLGLFEPQFGELIQAHESATIEVPARQGEAEPSEKAVAERHPWVANQVRKYLLVYVVKILVVAIMLGFFFKYYLAQFPLRLSGLAIAVGIAGVVLWIGLCQLGIERWVWSWFSSAELGGRSHFNPFLLIDGSVQQALFMIVRFAGLVVIVPICEELFLRGFLLRIVDNPQWWNVRLAEVGTRALVVAPLYGALTHPGELVAAVVWFSLINWLMKRTGNFWDCVLAHAVTNLLLGIYVITFSQWDLW